MESLQTIISNNNSTFSEIYNEFSQAFSTLELQACGALGILIDCEVLSLHQKLSALWIIFKLTFTRKLNSFFPLFDKVVKTSDIPNEKKFAQDQVIGNQIDEYSNKTPLSLDDFQREFTEKQDLPEAYNEAKNKFESLFISTETESNQDNNSNGKMNSKLLLDLDYAEINHTIKGRQKCDMKLLDTSSYDFNKDVQEEDDLKIDGFRPELVRLMPAELPISDDELKWIIPFAVDDPMWDHEDFDLKKTISQLIIKASQTSQIQPEQKSLMDMITFNPYALGEDDIFIENISGIVEHNPKTISSIMVYLSDNYKELMTLSLKKFVNNVKITINSLEVVFYILQTTELPQEFLDCYIYEWFKYCKTLNDDPKNQARKLKLISKFLTHQLEKKLFDATTCYEVWINFCTEFDHFKCAKDLQKLQIDYSSHREGGDNNNQKK